MAGVLDPREVEIALDSALHKRLVSISSLQHAFEIAPKSKGVGVLRRLASERVGKGLSESGLETKFFRVLLKYRVPLPKRQHSSRFGGKTSRLDLAYVEERVAIEVDSCEWHAVITYFQSDRQRDRRLAVEGWITLRYTDLDIKERPEEIAAEIKKVFEKPKEPTDY